MNKLTLFMFIVCLQFANCEQNIDENGYIVYCPCMGRFGNQAEQLLGSLLFAKHLNRTLVLPPFIEYNNFEVQMVPFDKYIDVESISLYHKVVTMENFMENIAPTIWKPERRVITCYKPRGSQEEGCNPFEGNPFKPFWYHFNITKFVSSDFHYPLVMSIEQANEWAEKYKTQKVISFVGPPSSFPAIDDAIPIAEYIHFSSNVQKMALDYKEMRQFARMPYLAIHLRHGSDWIKACNLLKENEMSQFFSSQQCTTQFFENSKRPLPYELCLPSFRTIVNYINNVLKSEKNVHKIQTIYFSTDFDDKSLWQKLKREFKNITLVTPSTTYADKKITGFKPPPYIVDLYLMVFSNYFIGNCISSFSAFASRLRVYNLHFRETTQFFAQLLLYKDYNFVKDEL